MITDGGWRRRHDEEERRLVRGAFSPGVKVAEFARAEGVDASLLCRWRRHLLGAATERPSFAPLVAATEAEPLVESAAPEAPEPGIVEVELACGARLRITGAADREAIRAIVGVLRGRRR